MRTLAAAGASLARVAALLLFVAAPLSALDARSSAGPGTPWPAGEAAIPLQQADTATYIVRLGVDTVAVEKWVRAPDRFEAVNVIRTPETRVRNLTVRLDAEGRPVAFTLGPAGEEAEERTISPVGAVPMAGGFYAPFGLVLAQAVAAGTETTEVGYLMGESVQPVPVRRAGPGVFELSTQFGGAMQARVDEAGAVERLGAEGGWTVERVPGLDVEAMTREFVARDQRGEGLGPLSPRETTRFRVHGAGIEIEYSRPAARGREVFGGLVPYGEVWRTGADVATRLTTDAPLEIGGVTLEPGDYSLFTVPNPDRWELIINSETGQGGLARDPDLDVARMPMQVRSLDELVDRFTILAEEEGDAGVLRLRWERTEAYVPFRVRRAAGS